MFRSASEPMPVGFLSYCYNPGYYPADAGDGKGESEKEKDGEGERGADRQSRLLASTATTWPTRSPKVSSTLTDLSIGSSRTVFSLSLSLSEVSSEIFGFLWNLLEMHTPGRTFLSRP